MKERKHRTINFQTNEVMATIEWFQNSNSFDLAILMEKSRFLAVQRYAMADLVGEAKKAWIAARVKRKKMFAQLRNQFFKAGAKSIADAVRQAEVEPAYELLYEAEKDAEATWEHGDNLLRALAGILDAMRQEIAELRAEKKAYEDENTFEKVVERVVKIVRERDAQFPISEPPYQ